MILDKRQIQPVFKEYVDANYEKLLNTKYEDIENKILKQYGDESKEMETLILMVFLLAFNEETSIWDYVGIDERFADLIDDWEYLQDNGLKNYWEWKIYE